MSTTIFLSRLILPVCFGLCNLTASAISNRIITPDKAVQLLSFMGNREQGYVTLYWTTTHTQSEDVFVIERSTDGLLFTEAGKVLSSVNKNNYSFNDTINGHTLYYRIRIRSLHGDIGYSTTILIKQNKTAPEGIALLQNPVANTIPVTVALPKRSVVNIWLTDLSGRMVFHQLLPVVTGDKIDLPIPVTIANGHYILTVTSGQVKLVRQVMIWR